MREIGCGRGHTVVELLSVDPELAKERLQRAAEFFLAERHAQVYAGDTLLHAASFTYDVYTARHLVSAGADVHAKNRRGAEPLHAAVIGAPGSDIWDPDAQVEMIAYLVEAGAGPNAPAPRGGTPFDPPVRHRCSRPVPAP